MKQIKNSIQITKIEEKKIEDQRYSFLSGTCSPHKMHKTNPLLS